MKKLIAVAGAVAIIGVAFIGRGLLFDDDSGGLSGGDAPTRLLCPEEFEDVCDGIDAEVEYEVAGRTADRLIGATDADVLDGRGWVVPKAWAEMVAATREFEGLPVQFEISDPLASTGVTVVIWDDRATALGCGDDRWSCLAEQWNQPIPGFRNDLTVGIPNISSATGLPVAAAQATGVIGSPDFDRTELSRPSRLGERQYAEPLAVMITRGQGELIAATVAHANVGNPSTSRGEIAIWNDISPQLRIDLVVVTAKDETVDDDLLSEIEAAFEAAGWDEPGSGEDGMPNGDLLAAIRDEWSK